MNNKKILGWILIMLGVFLSFMQGFRLTGNAIGNYFEIGIGFVILILFIGGIFLLRFSIDDKVERKKIPAQERQEIKNAFKTWDGRKITKPIKKIMKAYGIKHEYNGKHHNEFYIPGAPNPLTSGGTSNFPRSGLNFARNILEYIEKYGKKE